MALDSAGYNTANAYSAGNTLATGMQRAAMYDPTEQSTSLHTSVAGSLNSQNTLQQDSASDTQNLTSTQPSGSTLSNATNNTAYPHALSAKSLWAPLAGVSVSNTATNTVTPTGNQAVVAGHSDGYGGYYDAHTTPASTVVSTPTGGAAGINANPSTAGQTLTDYSAAGGSNIVAYRTSDGQFAYYQFNPKSSSYSYIGAFDSNGNQTAGQQQYIDDQGNVRYVNTLTPSQRASATLQSLGAGQSFGVANAGANTALVNQYNQAAINAWKTANQAATANAQQSALNTQTAAVLQYMEANGGKLPSQYAPGMSGAPTYSDAAMSAAQTQYQAYVAQRQAENANAALLRQYANKPIDTKAVDATSQEAINAYNSIGASQGGGADGGAVGRLGALNAAALVGQGALNHQTAAAQSYYTNLQAFGDALSAQATTDANATQTKLNSDVQNVQDVASALEQNLSQLDTTTQQRVKTQLDNLQNQIAQYQYAMQYYKDNTALIHNLAIGILSLGGAIAAAATGGLAGIGIAAATAATSAATK